MFRNKDGVLPYLVPFFVNHCGLAQQLSKAKAKSQGRINASGLTEKHD